MTLLNSLLSIFILLAAVNNGQFTAGRRDTNLIIQKLMKTILPKKSQSHQEIINEIAEVIKEAGKKKITHIILFGSFARGDWLDDFKQESDGTWLEYISDYDFLVIKWI